jgi:hypothetical protein
VRSIRLLVNFVSRLTSAMRSARTKASLAHGERISSQHLEARMRQSRHLSRPDALDEQSFRELLQHRIESVDLTHAAEDVRRFLTHPSAIDVWSRDFFIDLARRILIRP